MLAFLSFCAWCIFVICCIGYSIDHAKDSARLPKEEQEKFTAGDVAAIPGTIMYLMLPFALVGGFLYLLALPFL